MNGRGAVGTVCYVVTLPDGGEVFVRVTEELDGKRRVEAATRRDPWATWGPPLPVEVRP